MKNSKSNKLKLLFCPAFAVIHSTKNKIYFYYEHRFIIFVVNI